MKRKLFREGFLRTVTVIFIRLQKAVIFFECTNSYLKYQQDERSI